MVVLVNVMGSVDDDIIDNTSTYNSVFDIL